MNEKDLSNPTKGIKSGYSRSGLEKMTEHDLVKVNLKDFLAIVLDAEGKKRRHALVGKKSPIRGFLLFKLTFLTRIGKRLSYESREKLRREKAILLYEMMRENKDFFNEFNSETEGIRTINPVIEIELEKVDVSAKKSPKGVSYRLSLEQLTRFSMTSVDITNMLDIPAWIIIILHIFREHLPRKNPILLDDLTNDGFSFNRTLVDTVLSKNKILTERQKAALSSVLKGEKGVEAIKNVENIFFSMDLARAVLVPQTLNKFRLSDKFVSVLAGIPICKLQLENSSWGKSIIITAVSGSEYSLTANRISIDCPLNEKCQKLVKRFRSDSSCRLSCKQCPLRDKHKRQGEESSYGISAARNFLAT